MAGTDGVLRCAEEGESSRRAGSLHLLGVERVWTHLSAMRRSHWNFHTENDLASFPSSETILVLWGEQAGDETSLGTS